MTNSSDDFLRTVRRPARIRPPHDNEVEQTHVVAQDIRRALKGKEMNHDAASGGALTDSLQTAPPRKVYPGFENARTDPCGEVADAIQALDAHGELADDSLCKFARDVLMREHARRLYPASASTSGGAPREPECAECGARMVCEYDSTHSVRQRFASPARQGGEPKCARCDDTGCPECDPEWAQHQVRCSPEQETAIEAARQGGEPVQGEAVALTNAECDRILRQCGQAANPYGKPADLFCLIRAGYSYRRTAPSAIEQPSAPDKVREVLRELLNVADIEGWYVRHTEAIEAARAALQGEQSPAAGAVALADEFPTIARLANPTRDTIAYQGPELVREAINCFNELRHAREEADRANAGWHALSQEPRPKDAARLDPTAPSGGDRG